MIRSFCKYVPSKQPAEFLVDLKRIYTSLSEQEADAALASFLDRWEEGYPVAIRDWKYLTTFLKYPPELRKVIYTTNAVEVLHRQLRKVTKNRSILSNNNALFTIAVRDITEK
jgi:transposase-like protein